MLLNPHVFSSLVLGITSVVVFYKHYNAQPFENRVLWGIFFLSISLNAIVELLAYIGIKSAESIQELTLASERTLGAVCLVSASWCLIMRYQAQKFLLFSTIGLGFLLFYCVTWFKVEYMGLIIQPLCIIITLLISCLGLGYKQKSALWVIFAMMLLALSTKSQKIPIPMDPVDINRYMMVLAVICFGNAIRDQYKILF